MSILTWRLTQFELGWDFMPTFFIHGYLVKKFFSSGVLRNFVELNGFERIPLSG
ncbi:hypothetical protein NOC27_697 [Nitrosococcus oceani AFC27]|nr:hypothetical protein NOC27_697 [Nitrosococcus oceani AFC27]